MVVRHLDIEGVVEIHRQIMEAMGEKAIILFRGALEYCVDSAQDMASANKMYNACVQKAAYYIWCLIINHPFLDGNKRTAFEVARVFLLGNGYTFALVDKDDVVSLLTDLAIERVSITELRAWIERHISSL